VAEGRDSIGATRLAISRQLRRRINEVETRVAFSKDLGIILDHVFPIEQPRNFHLGLATVPVGPGRMVIQDTREEARLQRVWLEEDLAKTPPKTARERSAVRAKLAELARIANGPDPVAETERDLRAAGVLEIVRAPGRFSYPVPTNFFAAELGTAPSGRRFMVTMGSDPRAEAAFAQQILALKGGVDVIHFFDARLNDRFTKAGAGVECYIKSEGTIAAPAFVRR
jgi:hypothetical protein